MEYAHIWSKVLREDEKVNYEFSIGKRFRMLGLIPVGIFGLPFLFAVPPLGLIIILIGVFYFDYYLKVANAYALTDTRILIHRGWLSTDTISVEYKNITDIRVKEPFIERLLAKTGEISINTAGSGATEIVLKHIQAPYELRKRLEKIKN